MGDEDKSKEDTSVEPGERSGIVERAAPSSSQGSSVDHELQLRTLLEHSPDVLTLLDRDGRLVYLNRTVPGRTLSKVVGTQATDHMPPEERARFEAAFSKVLANGEPQHLSVSTNSGFVWESRLVPLRDGERVLGVMGIGSDVTEHRRAERALRESEEKLRLAVAATGIGLWKWDLGSDEITWDDAALRVFGLGPQEAPRTPAQLLELVHSDDCHHVVEVMSQSARTGIFEDFEFRVVTPLGEGVTVLCKGTSSRGPDGELAGFLGGIFDITERKRLEEQLRQSQKMEALGQLTAGIAHNFNNMLTVILSNVHLCESRAPEALRPRLNDAAHAARRAADMVRELMVFARHYPPSTRRALDLRAIVTRTVDICRTTFDKRIDLRVEQSAQLPPVLGDPGQLEQVVLNICLNARDALEEASTTERPAILLHLFATSFDSEVDRQTVHLRIRDNGPGMSEAVRRRIFEPFFTTKEIGRGTGLGLATAYGIITEHGGEIECWSTQGAGALFEIRLPATQQQQVSGAEREAERAQSILLVEDDEAVRRTTKTVLASGGYEVIEAEDGEVALALFDEDPERVDLIMLDWTLPKLPGASVLAELVRRAPSVRVVLFSGDEPVQELPSNVRAVVCKPSSIDELLCAVRAALDGDPP